MGSLLDIPPPLLKQVQTIGVCYGITGRARYGQPKMIEIMDALEGHLGMYKQYPRLQMHMRRPIIYCFAFGMPYVAVPDIIDVNIRNAEELARMRENKPFKELLDRRYQRHVPEEFAMLFHDIETVRNQWPRIKAETEAWNQRMTELSAPVDVQDVLDTQGCVDDDNMFNNSASPAVQRISRGQRGLVSLSEQLRNAISYGCTLDGSNTVTINHNSHDREVVGKIVFEKDDEVHITAKVKWK